VSCIYSVFPVILVVTPRVWAFICIIVVGFIVTWRSLVLWNSSVEGIIVVFSLLIFGVGI